MAAEGDGSLRVNEVNALECWHCVVDSARPAIVALQVMAVRSFQDDTAGSHSGTGFVVDAERGFLITNRHVCTCGPERSSATFVGCPSMEEVPVDIAYVDPGHDFAILHFDPSKLRQTPRKELKLDPAGCRVGEEIRVIGNDSMEKLQILAGTIARIDRNPPDLDGDYQDENTFYALAGTGSCGGSSGSPVIDRQGRAVAINAACVEGTMHSLFLPVHRVQRALELVRAGAPVPRGTLCTSFTYRSFPECDRLGVPKDFVQEEVLGREAREGGTFTRRQVPGGMLVVKRCIPGTTSAKALRTGDVLLELDGEPCTDFALLDAVLDSAVGGSVRLSLCRDGERLEVALPVQDLHALIPHAFVELGLGVFHEVPYQTAMTQHIPIRGVYVAQAGFVFGEAVTTDVVILSINGTPCDDLSTFTELLETIGNKDYFSVAWMTPNSGNDRRTRVDYVQMQRQWSLFRAWTLDRKTREWIPRSLGIVNATEGSDDDTTASCGDSAFTVDEASSVFDETLAELPKPIPTATLGGVVGEATTTAMPAGLAKEPPVKRARTSGESCVLATLDNRVCSVLFRTVQNFALDVVGENEKGGDVIMRWGAGIVIDPEKGLVLTDRGTVPQRLADIEVSLGQVVRSASVLFLHPVHSFVVLKLDEPSEPVAPARFGEAAVFEERIFEAGDDVQFLGVDASGQRFASQLKIQAVRLGDFPRQWPPRWCERNLEAVLFVEDPSGTSSGVLCDSVGRINALYTVVQFEDGGGPGRCGYGLPTHVVLPLLKHLSGPDWMTAMPVVPSLEMEYRLAELQKLRRLPPSIRPSAEWLKKLAAVGKSALQVVSITAKGPCDGLIGEGDVLVAVCGEVVVSVQAIEARLQQAVAEARAELADAPVQVKLTVLRRGKERNVSVTVPLLGSDGTTRLLSWHGLLLHETPRAVREFGPAPVGVYISQTFLGSPAEAEDIEGEFIVAVDGEPTPTLDALAATCQKSSLPAGTPVSSTLARRSGEQRHLRVESADVSGRRFMKTLVPDPLFWPTFEMSQDQHGAWSCFECKQV